MPNTVLIAYASRHGSTEGIAERIAVALRARAIDADVVAVEDVHHADRYDGYVLGSAVYAGSWLGSMQAFIHRHRATLRHHPVWLFSSGPLSSEPATLSAAAPRAIVGIERELDARGHTVFPGAWHRNAKPIGVLERVMHAIPAAREALPEGDFRDWAAIDAYATSVAGELELALQTE